MAHRKLNFQSGKHKQSVSTEIQAVQRRHGNSISRSNARSTQSARRDRRSEATRDFLDDLRARKVMASLTATRARLRGEDTALTDLAELRARVSEIGTYLDTLTKATNIPCSKRLRVLPGGL